MDVALLLTLNTGLLEEFPQRSNEVVDKGVREKLLKQQQRLSQISSGLERSDRPSYDSKKDEEVLSKVKRAFNRNDGNPLDPFELKRLAYNLSQLKKDEDLFKYAVSCIADNCKIYYLNGIVYSLCNSWNEYEYPQRVLLYELIKDGIENVDDRITRYQMLKHNLAFLSETGPKLLATRLVQQNVKLVDAPRLLGFRSESLDQSYYSDVVVEYVKQKNIVSIVDIEQLLNLHKKDRTRKLLYAQLVENAEKSRDVVYQQKVSESVNRRLGDISTDSTWAPFVGATDNDIERLNHAKKVTKLWFIRKAIEVFFERCVQDSQRKRFWLSYLDHIYDFKIAGSDTVKMKLQGDSRLSYTSIRNCFIQSNSQSSDTAALILKIKDRVFVEFSDIGALYCYKSNHPKAVYISKHWLSIDKVDVLKETQMGLLISNDTNYCDEGKVVHIGRWEQRMRGWMRSKLGLISYNISI